MAFPVPRSFVGKSSGESAYNTPYITLLVNVNPQFHPSSASDVRAVVLAKRKTPVSAVKHDSLNNMTNSTQIQDIHKLKSLAFPSYQCMAAQRAIQRAEHPGRQSH